MRNMEMYEHLKDNYYLDTKVLDGIQPPKPRNERPRLHGLEKGLITFHKRNWWSGNKT